MTENPPEVPGEFTVTPDTIALFCFSAATWNPHRIHYDADYARTVEGYPDVLVPGPMLGAWLLELADAWAQGRGLVVAEIEYRNIAPAYVDRTLTVTGRESTTDSGVSLEVFVNEAERNLCLGVVRTAPA
ncbi:MaoC/PaaZ C-terminal domain-containing protein [Nocardia grenadensis]|uniref:MaoC/PaaZ C-terminal domain-containing protein n=1 Tax=Nocardia grenadensis TaxID=931537 RepID=UPI003D744C01